MSKRIQLSQWEKSAMAQVKPIFTINDFPMEIIQRFAPDLRARTISTLRLVSLRFWEVFTADGFYRSYLCYPYQLNFYQQDLKEIGDVKGRWRRLLEAEKSRLDNWRNGRTTRVDIVEFPNCIIVGSFEGLIDENGEYWMLCKCMHDKILLLNFTKKPILTEYDISSYGMQTWNSCAEIAPGQIVISGGNTSHVFKYLKHSDSLSLEYKFKIEGMQTERVIISGKSNVVSGQRNLLINYKRTGDMDGLLRVWDITNENELESIDLRDFSQFTMFFKQTRKSSTQTRKSCSLHVFTGAYPNVLVIASVDTKRSMTSSAAIINIESRQITNSFGSIENLDLYHVFLNESYAGLFNYNTSDSHNTLKLYDLRNTFDIIQQEPVALVTYKQGGPIQPRLLKTSLQIGIPLLYREKKDMYAISTDGSEIVQRKHQIPGCMNYKYSSVYAIVGPFWIFEAKEVYPSQTFKTFDEHGNELFDWKTKLQENRPEHGWRHADMEQHVDEEHNNFERHQDLKRFDFQLTQDLYRMRWEPLPHDIEHLQTLFKFTLKTESGNLVIFNF